MTVAGFGRHDFGREWIMDTNTYRAKMSTLMENGP